MLFETEGDKYIPQMLTSRNKYQFLLALLMFVLNTLNWIFDLENTYFSSDDKCPFSMHSLIK